MSKMTDEVFPRAVATSAAASVATAVPPKTLLLHKCNSKTLKQN